MGSFRIAGFALSLVFLISSEAFCGFVSVGVGDYIGSRSTANGEIFGNGGWATSPSGGGFQIEWEIVEPGENGFFSYTYHISGENGALTKDLSHLIISLSDGVQINEAELDDVNLISHGTWSGDDGNSNPGLPTPFYGVKFDVDDGISTFSVTFTTDRAPVWGSFYAKDGKTGGPGGGDDVYAYNVGLENGAFLAVNNPDLFLDYIATPDTTTFDDVDPPNVIPEPSSVLLLMVGVVGMAGFGYRRRKATRTL